jgi:predicted nucleic acid-binding protein
MLYLDASALVKRYIDEPGTLAVAARFESGERIFTSALSYAEILTAFGRRYQQGELARTDFESKREDFLRDWMFSLIVLELDTRSMSSLGSLVTRFALKAGDAVHLSAALWLRDAWVGIPRATGEQKIEFGVADKSLARIAAECGLSVFNPEAAA